MAEVSPVDNPEELQELSTLPDLALTDGQKAVDKVAVQVINGGKKADGVELADYEVTVIDSSQASEMDQAVQEQALTSIQGDTYVFSSQTVAKFMNFLATVSLDTSTRVGRKERKAERKEMERENVKRRNERERVQKEDIAGSVEKKRAVLRGLRNFLKKDDMEDHRSFLRAFKNLSKGDQIELGEAFQQMREDWRLFEGMSSLYEGRIEGELRGEEPIDPKSQ